MRHPTIVLFVCALALVAGAQSFAADAPGIVVEGGSVTALNSTLDIGLSVSVGTELPKWVPVLGTHYGFVDLLTVNRQQAIGLSVSTKAAASDDGWRLGATVTQPTDGTTREVLGYVRYGVRLW